ncbi:RagB/SusD family nutrient uptake outer membrane protein [Dysgonomonas sp. 521]|uniref:RagB/SusD family nutrient uptake outer membrane protein n=1 Tax=Dysgonomonas sp. 521 TaxID=2302932 RepID=UPI0013D6FF31|nr:RagB/SusD family nutrient uptake outer membrane protein [Dysgonomonas sp. 521]NDV93969.1 RagB/SusD family nutrient uptake outer membrane protein [Dysgonomonas sp. 521]
MKTINNILIIISFLCLLAFTSCNDVLDQAPDGKTSLDEVFADHFKTGAYLNTCYAKLPLYGKSWSWLSRGPVSTCDDAWDNDEIIYPYGVSARMMNGVASADQYPMTSHEFDFKDNHKYERHFAAIYDCSVFIQRIGGANVKTEAERNRWKAEAHLLRAYYYSELLRWFGTGVPIIREPYSLEDDYTKIEKPSFIEVVRFIIEDCDVALNTAELPWRITTGTEKARATKALAEAIKSRMMLYAASPLYNDGADLWEEAYQVNKTALQNLRTNGYQLYNKVHFPDIFSNDQDNPENETHVPTKASSLMYEYFTQNYDYSANPIDTETIYSSWTESHWNSEDYEFHFGCIGAQTGGKSGSVPTQELVDAYETTNGKTVLDLKKPYLDEKHLDPNYNKDNTLYDPKNPYKNRDPRFYSSIYFNGSKRTCKWEFSETPECKDNFDYSPNGNGPVYRTRIISTWLGEPITGIDTESRTKTRTGYYCRKYTHPNSGWGQGVVGPVEKLFRLAEIILNCAETAAESGHLDEAYALVNEVRARVSMPALPADVKGNKEQLILRIRHERRVELALEPHRFFDVRRWQKPDGDLKDTDKWLTAMEITRVDNPDGSFSHFSYKRRSIRPQERLCYTNKYLKAPIPKSEASKMYNLTGVNWQNPGW